MKTDFMIGACGLVGRVWTMGQTSDMPCLGSFCFLFFFVLSSKRTYRSKQLSASSDGHVQLLRSGLFDTLSSVMPSLVDEKRFKHKVLSY